MMLERVTLYLQAIEDETRLDLVRRCFYLKVCEKLSRERACVGWRREVVSHLVKEWGWDEKRLMMLDNRANWKIDEVRKAHNELLDAMMQSYRNLIRFARRNNLSVSASPQDIGVLTRKLYAAFEALPGKVTLVNPQISPDLSEPNLTFIHVPPGRANRTGWYVYNRAPDMESIISHQPLEYNRYLNKLVAWAWFNGLLTSRTRLFIKGNGIVDLAKLQEMVADVAHHFPLRLPSPTPKALYSPCEIRHLAIIVNLEYDPTAAFRNQVVHFDFRKLDVFSFGEEQKCLIGSIDLLYRNSWNEVRTLHFNGEQAMIEALKTILGKMHQDAAPPDSVEVFCYSQHLRGLIRTRVQQLVSECVELRLSSTRQDTGRFKALRVSGQTWGCSSSALTSRYRSWKTPSNSTARFRITNCTVCRCRWKPTTSGCRRWWMVLPAKGSFSSSLKMRITITDLTSIFLMRATAPRCITTARAAKRSWCVTSAASTLRRMTALPTAPALSTLTCRSFIKSSTSTVANR
jgi:adenylate cyclase class 1